MSATGRGAIRHPDDYYATPGFATRAVLPVLLPQLPAQPVILEPAAGEGAILVELLRAGIDLDHLFCVEIDETRHAACAALGVHAYQMDFRKYADEFRSGGARGFDLVLGNPPFALAMEFVRDALSITAPGGATVMLLRMPWLGSQERAPWLRANTPTINQLDRRPSFYEGKPPTPQAGLFGESLVEDTGGSGSDNTEYGWFEWRLRTDGSLATPTVRILECEKSPRRRRAA